MAERIVAMATMFAHGSIHVPVSVQKLLNVKDGEMIIFIQKNEEIVIRPALLNPVKPKATRIQMQEFGKD